MQSGTTASRPKQYRWDLGANPALERFADKAVVEGERDRPGSEQNQHRDTRVLEAAPCPDDQMGAADRDEGGEIDQETASGCSGGRVQRDVAAGILIELMPALG